MSMLDRTIRAAEPGDAVMIADIYDFHARNGTASFETKGPSVRQTKKKIERIKGRGWPFLVAEVDGAVVGYAYGMQFRDRVAYAFTCENSLYVKADMHGQGIGKALLHALLKQAEACGFRQMLAVIGGNEAASVRVHESCGFEYAGRMKAVGWKKGRWLDTVYMQRTLGDGSSEPAHR